MTSAGSYVNLNVSSGRVGFGASDGPLLRRNCEKNKLPELLVRASHFSEFFESTFDAWNGLYNRVLH